jgi:Tfp pilus assembly protein PilZ
MLRARYTSGVKFLESYDPRLPGLRLRVREALPVGELVLVEVCFPELRDHMVIRGEVAWCRRERFARLPAVGVAFLEAEARRRDHLVTVASGTLTLTDAAGKRRYLRVPVDVPVMLAVAGEAAGQSAALTDIGAGGAFVRTESHAAPGTDVVVRLVPPGAVMPMDIAGVVAWCPSQGGGFGVEFRWRDTGGIRRLREVVRRLGATPEQSPRSS